SKALDEASNTALSWGEIFRKLLVRATAEGTTQRGSGEQQGAAAVRGALQLIRQTASQQEQRFHLQLQALRPRLAVTPRGERQQVNKPVNRPALLVNAYEQFLDGLGTGEVGVEDVLARRGTYEGNLLAEIAQPLRQSSRDAGTILRQKDGAAGEDRGDIR